MSLDALDAADRVAQLTALTERLTDLIAADTRAFEARRPQDAAVRIAETSELANTYRRESLRIRRDPSLLEGATLEARRRLVRATEAFEAVLARHGRALEAAKTVTEGLVQAIAVEVAAARASGAGYGEGGRALTGDASAITLNQRA
jgi:hypothetical protein